MVKLDNGIDKRTIILMSALLTTKIKLVAFSKSSVSRKKRLVFPSTWTSYRTLQ